MITITNQSDFTILAYNDFFEVRIPSRQTVKVDPVKLCSNYILTFSRVTWIKDDKSELVVEEYRRITDIINKFWIYFQTHIPMVTKLEVADNQKITLKVSEEPVRLAIISKFVHLNCIECETNDNIITRQKRVFRRKKDKERFIKLMRNGLVISSFVVAVLIFSIVDFALTCEDYPVFNTISFSLLPSLYFLFYISDWVSFIKYRKADYENEE